MSEDLKPGDEVWVRAKVVSDRDIADNQLSVVRFDEQDQLFWAHPRDIRKSPPSEQSETAELERNVVAAARDLIHKSGDLPVSALTVAVLAYEKALAPPSLEEQIERVIAEYEDNPKNVLHNMTRNEAAQRIRALVEAHKS